MEREEALQLKKGDTVYIVGFFNASGFPASCRVNGKVKTWKREPDRLEIPIKRGLREYGYINQDNLSKFSLKCPEKVPKNEVHNINKKFGGIYGGI